MTGLRATHEAEFVEDRQKGLRQLVWPIGKPLTFYSLVSATTRETIVPVVREFYSAVPLAQQLKAKWGALEVRQWEYDPEADDTKYVQVVSRVG